MSFRPKPQSWDDIKPGDVIAWTETKWSYRLDRNTQRPRRMLVRWVADRSQYQSESVRSVWGVLVTKADQPHKSMNTYPLTDADHVSTGEMGHVVALPLSQITSLDRPSYVEEFKTDFDTVIAKARDAALIEHIERGHNPANIVHDMSELSGLDAQSSTYVNDVEFTDPPRFPAGTPEYEAYATELGGELEKFRKGETPYGYGPIDKAAILSKPIDSLMNSGAAPATDPHALRVWTNSHRRGDERTATVTIRGGDSEMISLIDALNHALLSCDLGRRDRASLAALYESIASSTGLVQVDTEALARDGRAEAADARDHTTRDDARLTADLFTGRADRKALPIVPPSPTS